MPDQIPPSSVDPTTTPTKDTGDKPSDSWAMSIFAAAAFITWGLFANWHHGWGSRPQVATTQSIISLVFTYFSAELVVAKPNTKGVAFRYQDGRKPDWGLE